MNKLYKKKFACYIPKLMCKVSLKKIHMDAKTQLCLLIGHIVHKITTTTINLVRIIGEEKLTSEIFIGVVHHLFEGELAKNIVKECSYYLGLDQKNIKDELVFPFQLMRSLIKEHITSIIKISNEYMICLISTIEYILYEILDLADVQSFKNNSSKITPIEIVSAIKHDRELSIMCKKFNLQLIISEPLFEVNKFNKNIEKLWSSMSNLPITEEAITFLKDYSENMIHNLKFKAEQSEQSIQKVYQELFF